MTWTAYVNQLMVKWGLSHKTAVLMAELTARLKACEIYDQTISGWRDSQRQAEMRMRWDRNEPGDREGLRARPAEHSQHCCTLADGTPASEALDIITHDEAAAAEIAEGIGLCAGLRYRNRPDPVHFALPRDGGAA